MVVASYEPQHTSQRGQSQIKIRKNLQGLQQLIRMPRHASNHPLPEALAALRQRAFRIHLPNHVPRVPRAQLFILDRTLQHLTLALRERRANVRRFQAVFLALLRIPVPAF